MTRFEKIQLISSIFPVFSTGVIATITSIILRKSEAPFEAFVKFWIAFISSFIISYFLNKFCDSVNLSFLGWILITILLATTNCYFVTLQIKYGHKGTANTR